jgi:hypothetical protein
MAVVLLCLQPWPDCLGPTSTASPWLGHCWARNTSCCDMATSCFNTHTEPNIRRSTTISDDTVQSGSLPTFRRDGRPSIFRVEQKAKKDERASSKSLATLYAPEDKSRTFLRNVGNLCQTIRHHIPEDSTLHTEHAGVAIMLYTCFWKVLGSNIGRITGNSVSRGLPQSI